MKTPKTIKLLSVRLAMLFLAALATLVPQLSKAQGTLTNGLVAYWPFDTANGNVLTPDLAGGRDMLVYFGGGNLLTNFSANTVEIVPGYRSNAVNMVRTRTASVGYFST